MLALAGVGALALLGLVGDAAQIDARGEHAADLDGGVDLHDADKYVEEIKKVKINRRIRR